MRETFARVRVCGRAKLNYKLEGKEMTHWGVDVLDVVRVGKSIW